MVDKKRWRCLLDESLIVLIVILILTKEELTTDDLNKISQSIFHAFYVLFPSTTCSQKIGGCAMCIQHRSLVCSIPLFCIFYCLISANFFYQHRQEVELVGGQKVPRRQRGPEQMINGKTFYDVCICNSICICVCIIIFVFLYHYLLIFVKIFGGDKEVGDK